MTLKEFDEKYEEWDKNKLYDLIKRTISHFDILGCNLDDILNASGINYREHVILIRSRNKHEGVNINVKNQEGIILSYNVTNMQSYYKALSDIKMSNELKAKGIVLYLILKAFKIENLEMENALNSEELLVGKIEKLASMLLIPSKELNEEVAKDIIKIQYDMAKRDEDLVDIFLLRKLFNEKIKRKYHVSEKMINYRIQTTDFGYHTNDSYETIGLDTFISYSDAAKEKGKPKTIKNEE